MELMKILNSTAVFIPRKTFFFFTDFLQLQTRQQKVERRRRRKKFAVQPGIAGVQCNGMPQGNLVKKKFSTVFHSYQLTLTCFACTSGGNPSTYVAILSFFYISCSLGDHFFSCCCCTPFTQDSLWKKNKFKKLVSFVTFNERTQPQVVQHRLYTLTANQLVQGAS